MNLIHLPVGFLTVMLRCSQSLIAIYFAFFSNVSHASIWEYVVTSEYGNVYYIDPLSIHRKDKTISYTQLTDYSNNPSIRKDEMQSIVQHKTNDCVGHRFYISGLVGYEKGRAKGDIMVVEIEKEVIWLNIITQKIADIIHQKVCNYKY